MDIKYNVSKYKDSKIQEIKDSISVEEPLEMRLRFKKNHKWETQNISITMRTPNNDKDLIRGFLFNEGIIESLKEIDSIEQKGDDVGDYNLKNIIEATINNTKNLDIGKLKRKPLTKSSSLPGVLMVIEIFCTSHLLFFLNLKLISRGSSIETESFIS